jgi:hypothetical protein
MVGGACAHFVLRARDGVDDLEGLVDLDGVRSGSGKALGWPRVETMFGYFEGEELYERDELQGRCNCSEAVAGRLRRGGPSPSG